MTLKEAWNGSYRRNRLKWRGTTNFNPGLPKGSTVLEAGCGNGKNLTAIFGRGLKIYAVDYSEEAVRESKALAERLGEKVVFSVESVDSLSFKGGFFDAVFCFHVLGHLTEGERRKAVEEMARVLKKGGKLFLRDFSAGDARFGKGLSYEKSSFVRKGILTHYFDEKEVLELFSGFCREKFERLRWSVCWAGKNYAREVFDCVFVKSC